MHGVRTDDKTQTQRATMLEVNRMCDTNYIQLAGAIVEQAHLDYVGAVRELREPANQYKGIPHNGQPTPVEIISRFRNHYSGRFDYASLCEAYNVGDIKEMSAEQIKHVVDNMDDFKTFAGNRRHRLHLRKEIRQIKEFMRSEWFVTLTAGIINGNEMLRQWESEANE